MADRNGDRRSSAAKHTAQVDRGARNRGGTGADGVVVETTDAADTGMEGATPTERGAPQAEPSRRAGRVLVNVGRRIRRIDTTRWRLGGAIAGGVVVGVVGGLLGEGVTWARAVSGGALAVMVSASLYGYWRVAPRIGRLTTLAALSLAWGVVLALLSLGISGDNSSSQNTTAWGLGGVILVWSVAALFLPAAWMWRTRVRFRARRQARREAREADAAAKRRAKNGRFTPKSGARSAGRGPHRGKSQTTAGSRVSSKSTETVAVARRH